MVSSGATFHGSLVSIVANDWNSLANGIDNQLFHLTSPRHIDLHVARMDRIVSTVTIDIAIARGSLVEGRETVSGMAARYNRVVEIRLGLGTDYPVVGSLAIGAEGTIPGMHYNELGGQTGWAQQDALSLLPVSWPPGWFLPVIRK